MSLHDQIMNIPEENDDGLLIGEDKYWIGFVNGKHQAAQIAKEADELMAEMAKCLEDVFMISIDQRSSKCGVMISDLLAKYYSLEERKNELN